MKMNIQKGFTLIETIVVMAIIGMFSFLAIGGYNTYRKEALINFSIDMLASELSAAKNHVRSGAFAEKAIACEGIVFVKNEGFFEAWRANWGYSSLKIFVDGKWVDAGCGGEAKMLSKLDFEPPVEILEVSAVESDFFIRYLPPGGDVQVSTMAGMAIVDPEFRIGFITDESGEFQKTINFDSVTNKFL